MLPGFPEFSAEPIGSKWYVQGLDFQLVVHTELGPNDAGRRFILAAIRARRQSKVGRWIFFSQRGFSIESIAWFEQTWKLLGRSALSCGPRRALGVFPMMPFSLDQIWVIAGGTLPGMLGIAAGRGNLDPKSKPRMPRANAGGVAVIPIVGPMSKYADIFSFLFGGAVMTDISTAVRSAAANPNVQTIVLYIDSPGGSAAGIDELAQAIFDAHGVKSVIGCISDLACSGAYWAASQCTKLYANQNAFIGSIGVYSVILDLSTAYEMAGVKVEVVRAGELKGIGEDEITPAQRTELQSRVDAIHRQFIAAVAHGRMMPADRVRGLADGRVFIAAEAQRLGLIDGVKSFDAVLQPFIDAHQQRLASIEEKENEIYAAEKREIGHRWRNTRRTSF